MKSIANSNRPKENLGSDQGIYQIVQAIAIEDLTSKFKIMIEAADTVLAEPIDGWKLNSNDSTRLIQFLNSRKPLIQSSFTLRLKQNFAIFKSATKLRVDNADIKDHRSLRLTDAELLAENQAMQRIIVRCEKSHRKFYALSSRRLQQCVQRTQTNQSENPLHVKRLWEAFQYSINTLNISSKFQIAVYCLFSHFVIDSLDSTYEKINQCLIKYNTSPNKQVTTVAQPRSGSATQTASKSNLRNIKAKQTRANVKSTVAPAIKAKSAKTAKPKKQGITTKAKPIAKTDLSRGNDKSALSNNSADHAANLRKGDWAEISHGRGIKLGKLAWKTNDSSQFIFVDAIGKRVKELSGTELNKALEDGSIKLVTTSSVIQNKVNYRVM